MFILVQVKPIKKHLENLLNYTNFLILRTKMSIMTQAKIF